MKIKYLALALSLLLAACNTIGNNSNQETSSDTEQKQSDENYTGIKKFMEGERLVKEITYKNGVKEGLCNNYYEDGRLKRTIWYANDLKEDTAKWYYKEGPVYRATPYSNNKIHGLQTKYHKNGRVMALIPYKHGLRTPGLKEFTENGLPEGKIPSIKQNINTRDYESEGIVTVVFTLSNKSKNVKYYKGGIIDGAFDLTKAKDITASTGMGYLELLKTGSGGKAYVDVVAEYTTRYRNREIIIKRIMLPYDDLK